MVFFPRKTYIIVLIVLTFSLMPVCAAYAASPQVRVSIDKNQSYWVGQKIPFYIDLLSPGYFSGTPKFDLLRPLLWVMAGTFLFFSLSCMKCQWQPDGTTATFYWRSWASAAGSRRRTSAHSTPAGPLMLFIAKCTKLRVSMCVIDDKHVND